MKLKKLYSFLTLLLTALFLLPWSGIKAETLDAGAGSASNEYLPIYGWNGDNNQHNQYIIPASELEAMQNGTITGMKFYTSAGYSNPSWNSGSAPTVTFKLAEVNATTLSGLLDIELTQVWSGTVAVSSGEWNITFDSSYSYGDGNLLVDVTVASNGYTHIYFVGEAITNAGFWRYGSYSSGSTSFIPKTTFTYTPGAAPTCPKTGTPQASNVEATTATISWSAGGTEDTWNLRYKTSSAAVWTKVSGIKSTSYDLSGLVAGKTTYNYEVQADCGGEDTSAWRAGIAFQTDCGSIAVPTDGWNYDFTGTSGTTPQCWTVIRTSDENYNAVIYSNSLRFNGNNSSSKKERRVVVILPAFQTDIRNLKISFKYQNKGTTTTYPQFFVGCTSSLTDVTQFKTLHTLAKYSSSMHSTGDLSLANADEGSYIAIMFTNPDGSNNDAGYSYIDDVKVESTQDCSAPQNVVLDGTTTSTADFTWNANTGVDSYKYCVVAQGEEADWSGNLSVNTNSVHVEGLSAGNYTFYVKCACGTAATSRNFSIVSCGVPTNMQFSNETYNSVTVTWTSAGETEWDLEYEIGDLGFIDPPIHLTEATYSFSGMATGSPYTIHVKAACKSDFSAGDYLEGTITPSYTAPVPVVSDETDAQATVTWAEVSDADSYEYVVMLGTADADWTSPETTDATSATLTGLTGGSSYTVYVRSVYGSSRSTAGSAAFTTTTIAPNTPTVDDYDASSATLSWTNSGAATQYQWACKASGTPGDGDWSAATSATSVEVTGLTGNTNYTFYVRSYYAEGKVSAYASKGFKTDCGTYPMPFAEAFNTSSVPACWDVSVHSDTYDAWGTTTAARVGTTGYSMQYYAPYTGSADMITPSIYLSEEANLRFYVKNYHATYGAVTGEVYIKTSSATTKIYDIPGTANAFELKEIDLTAYKDQTVKFIFRGYALGSGKYASIYVDSVSVKVIPCDKPAFAAANIVVGDASATISCAESKWNLKYRTNGVGDWTTISNITEASRTITGLTNGTTYEVQIQAVCSATRSSGWTTSQTFTPVNCPVPTTLEATAITHNSATISWSGDAKAIRYKKGTDSWTNETISPAAETFDLSGLTPESTYTVQVKADCEEGDNWSAELEFATKCAPITVTKVAPYEADFTGLTDEMPGCWEKSETTYPYVTSEELKFYANEANQTAILPAFSNDIATLVLKFKYKNYSSLSGYGKLQVGYIDNAGDFQAVGSTLANKATYFETEINFEGVTGAKNMAIRFLDNSNAEAYSYVKDVVVELAPTCYAPASIADATSITAEGATISWTASGHGETLYQWTVVEGSATPAWVDDDAHKVDATSKTLTGLNPQTNYTFYVRSYCGASDQSAEVSKAFTTKCAAIPVADMPFEETFDGALGTCWRTYAATYYSVYVSSGELRTSAPKTTGNESVVVLPELAMPLNQLLVTFDYKGSNGTIEVGYVSNPENKTSFVAVGSAYTVATAYKHAATDFLSLGAVTGNVALRFKGNTGDGDFYVDNLHVAHGVALADADNNTATLAGLVGQTLEVTLGRTIYCDGDFNTLCLPFSLPTLAGTPLAGGELWSFRYGEVVGGELQIRIAPATSIEAGVPYLITFANGADIVNPTFTDVTITKSVGVSVGQTDDVQFIGILKPQAFVEEDKNNLFVASNGMLAWSNVGTGTALSNLRSFRGYFHTETAVSGTPVANNMPARIVKEEQTATGCENIQDNTVTIKIIENNQVVIIRNGVKYTVQGQVISK